MRDVQIPKLGMSTAEVDIGAWHVNVGDRVEIGSLLVDVESEKAIVTLESEASGVVAEILVRTGDIVNVGEVICRIEPA